jgi:hypothetical protein
LIRWHRKDFRLFWKWKSRSRGCPRVPEQLQRLIAEIATNNPTWGEERIAHELLLKIGIRISARTVRRYMPKSPQRPADPKLRWRMFVHNHAKAIIATDFVVVVTATFKLVYVFVIHDRDRIYSRDLDRRPKSLGLTILKTPCKAAKANAICERWIRSSSPTPLHSEGVPSCSDIDSGWPAS